MERCSRGVPHKFFCASTMRLARIQRKPFSASSRRNPEVIACGIRFLPPGMGFLLPLFVGAFILRHFVRARVYPWLCPCVRACVSESGDSAGNRMKRMPLMACFDAWLIVLSANCKKKKRKYETNSVYFIKACMRFARQYDNDR